MVPPGAHSHFAPIAPDSGPSFCRAAPRAPQSSGGHPFLILAASPYSQLPGVGSGQVVRAHERRRKGVGSWSAPSCDLGPPSLSLTLPATYGSSPLRSSPSTPGSPVHVSVSAKTPLVPRWPRAGGPRREGGGAPRSPPRISVLYTVPIPLHSQAAPVFLH